MEMVPNFASKVASALQRVTQKDEFSGCIADGAGGNCVAFVQHMWEEVVADVFAEGINCGKESNETAPQRC